MQEKVLIIGCGSQARYVIDILNANNSHKIIGAVDLESGYMLEKKINGVEVICTLEGVVKKYDPEITRLIVAHGQISKKVQAVEILLKHGFQFLSAISSLSSISPNSHLGFDCIVNPNVSIMPNVRIGNHVIIHSQSVIEHDNSIAEYCNIGPGVSLAGNVAIAERSYVYTGASIIPKVCIGKNCIIGAGSVVINDVKDNEVVAGVPAKTIGLNS
tara:strand:- start:13 stop:657 length:645 start_codon:yes stop_codon:yes gene_type:complete